MSSSNQDTKQYWPQIVLWQTNAEDGRDGSWGKLTVKVSRVSKAERNERQLIDDERRHGTTALMNKVYGNQVLDYDLRET